MSNKLILDTEITETNSVDSAARITKKHEIILIACLCLFAALRIFIFCAAFPPFANTDEPLHLDLVYKYALGHVPTGLDHFTKQAEEIELLYSSPEYMHWPDGYPDGKYPPPRWSMPKSEIKLKLQRAMTASESDINMESTQPPVYYALAAGWLKLGMLLGIKGGGLIYWLRFMNIWIAGLLVLLSYAFARRISPANSFIRLGVPLMVAVLPQDVFYSINNDILSPLMAGLALYCLLDICLSKSKSTAFHALTGLLTAAAFLVKFSNIAVLAALAFALVYRIIQTRRHKAVRKELRKTAVMLLVAALPIGLWLLRNYLVLGDITGSTAKVQYLGWQTKCFDELLDHPIFSMSGIITFCHDLLASFWRGEFLWHSEPLASRSCDLFYSISSVLFILTSGTLAFKRSALTQERISTRLCLLVFGVSVAFLAAISISYDFGPCFYPSNGYPYITSGRLIFGVIIPFLVLWMGGLDLLLKKIKLKKYRFAILAIICIIITSSEVVLSMNAFGSAYNWFHLR